MHSLPWVGKKIATTQLADLQEILTSVEKYLTNRQKNHLKVIIKIEVSTYIYVLDLVSLGENRSA
jgi:hypothetical protein